MYPLTKIQEKNFTKKSSSPYEKEVELQGDGNAEKHVKNNYETFQRRIKYLKKYSLKKNKMDICEFGCSSALCFIL